MSMIQYNNYSFQTEIKCEDNEIFDTVQMTVIGNTNDIVYIDNIGDLFITATT